MFNQFLQKSFAVIMMTRKQSINRRIWTLLVSAAIVYTGVVSPISWAAPVYLDFGSGDLYSGSNTPAHADGAVSGDIDFTRPSEAGVDVFTSRGGGRNQLEGSNLRRAEPPGQASHCCGD